MHLDEQQRDLLARAEQAAKPSDYAAGAMDALRRCTDDPEERRRIDAVVARHDQKKGART